MKYLTSSNCTGFDTSSEWGLTRRSHEGLGSLTTVTGGFPCLVLDTIKNKKGKRVRDI